MLGRVCVGVGVGVGVWVWVWVFVCVWVGGVCVCVWVFVCVCVCARARERDELPQFLLHTHTHTHTHTQLKEMEQERIAELGTTLGKPGAEEQARHRLTSGAGDLLSSAKLSIHNLGPDSKGGRDLGEGVCGKEVRVCVGGR